jgi:DNA polymerase-1
LKRELAIKGRPIIIHNSQFDVPLLEAEGITFGGDIWDSLMAAVQVQPDLYKGLNSVASLLLDIERWKHKGEAEPERYNATDAVRELQLYGPLCDELDKTGQRRLFEHTIMPGVRTLINMRRRGIKVHPERMETWRKTLTDKWSAVSAAWSAHTGNVDPDSNPSVHSYFFDHLNLPSQYNKYGGTTCDEAALVAMRAFLTRQPDSTMKAEAWHSIDLMLGYREVATMLRNFAKNFMGEDGCVHPSYLPLQKDDDRDALGKGMPGTGRVGARQPNMANQPQEARSMYIAHDPSMELVEADYSQIELRVAAAQSNDKALLLALEGDIHSKNMEILKCSRVLAKNVMYGTLYGGGPRKLSRVLQGKGVPITEREIREIQNALARAYPVLFAWRQRIVAEVGRNYFLTDPFDRRRYFNRGRGDAPAALDFIPQATAAGVMWNNLHPQACEAGFESLDGALLLTVYDSVLGEVPKGRRAETEEMLEGVMCRRWDNIAPGFWVPINIKWGDSWGEMI